MKNVPVTSSRGQTVLHTDPAGHHDLIATLRGDGYRMCIDLTVVDYLEHMGRDLPAGVTGERFEVVTQFLDHEQRRRIRVRTQVPADDATVPTITDLFPGADAMEREGWDMYGVGFDGHPDLSRILMPETWEGHPLRKDYDVGRIPVQFKQPLQQGGA